MKKILTLCLLAVTMCVVAQKKTVAVYVTGDDSMNQILGDRLVDGIAQSGKYTAVERTASFLQELSKEQNYQHTGAVDDDEISRVGKQFGVNYVCVATVLDVWEEKYLTSRLIDVETAEVVASSSSSGQIASSQQFIAAMNTLSNGLLNTLAQAQEGRKKVAVYVTKTGNKDVDIILGDKLVAGFAQSGRFCAVERTNGFLKQLGKEQTYQQSGAVDDRELSRLGKQFGVDYVCIAKTSSVFGDYFITSRLIDVETGEVANSDKAEGVKLNNSAEVVAVAKNIAKTLSGMTIKEQEEARLAEERRKAEEARLAEERRRAEEARLAELRRQAEEARLAEEARKKAQKEQILQEVNAKFRQIVNNGYFYVTINGSKYMVSLRTIDDLKFKQAYNQKFADAGYSNWRMADCHEIYSILQEISNMKAEIQRCSLSYSSSMFRLPSKLWSYCEGGTEARVVDVEISSKYNEYDDLFQKNYTKYHYITKTLKDGDRNMTYCMYMAPYAYQLKYTASIYLIRKAY